MMVDTISLYDPSNKDERVEEDGGAGGGVPGFLLWMAFYLGTSHIEGAVHQELDGLS